MTKMLSVLRLAVLDCNLSSAAVRILAAIEAFCDDDGWCAVSDAKLTAMLGYVKTHRAVRELSSHGYVECEKRGRTHYVRADLHTTVAINNQLLIVSAPDESAHAKELAVATAQAYAESYERRYAVRPVMNAKTRGQLARLVQRLGQDAPAVANYYPRNNSGLYVRAGHPVDLLLRDAEKLRTEWATGHTITEIQARQADSHAARADMVNALIEEARHG